MSASILGPSGSRMVAFGGNTAWKQFTKGDIAVSFQWINTATDDEAQPCMCLYPANRRAEAGAYVLPQGEAWRMVNRNGNPTQHLMGAAFKAAYALGSFPDKSTVHRIMDIVWEYMPELVKMPSTAPEDLLVKAPVQGIEVTVKQNDKPIVEAVI